MSARQYSSTVVPKTLTAITADTLTVNPDTSTLPTVYPYTLVINPDTASEEIVTVRSLLGGAVLNITRGQDGTGSTSHSAGAVIKHMITPRDMQEPQNHIEAAAAYTIKNDGVDTGVTGPTIPKSVHGIASGEGNVVGTDKTQVLKNKTLSGTGAGANTFTSIPQASITNLTTDLGLKAPLANPTFTGTISGNLTGNVTGNLTGNVTGNVSGSSGSTTGNAATATSLQTARNINGVSFNGTSDITVADSTKLPTAGGTVTGNLLVNGILRSGGATIYFGSNDFIEYDDLLNTFFFNCDGGFGNATVDCGGVDTQVFTASTVTTPYVEIISALCRPMDDNDTALGSVSPLRRWTRVFAVNTTISSSDERDKLDINDSPLGLDFINDLRPVSYRWKVGEKKTVIDQEGNPVLDADGNKTYEIREGIRKHYGLISQEVKQAVDNSGVDDFAGWVQDDLSDPESHQSISYEQFIAPLIKSVQELSAEVQTLKAKVAELEAK